MLKGLRTKRKVITECQGLMLCTVKGKLFPSLTKYINYQILEQNVIFKIYMAMVYREGLETPTE